MVHLSLLRVKTINFTFTIITKIFTDIEPGTTTTKPPLNFVQAERFIH
jgi:hypothetical protein